MKTKIIIFTFLCTYFQLNAQTFDNMRTDMTMPQFLSPEIISLGKYGQIPVSESTGVPNISIPLYTAKSGELELPIALRYHASGIKVNQEATWVGLGWDLYVGGSITKYTSGYDDCSFLNSTNPYKPENSSFAAFYNNKYDVGNEVSYIGTLESLANRESEPDIYQACFCGHLLTFFKDINGNFIQIGRLEDNYLISHSNTYSGEEWTITDQSGIRYTFGLGAVEGYHIQIGVPSNNDKTWYLRKIEHPQKGLIRFEYTEPMELFTIADIWEKSIKYYGTDTLKILPSNIYGYNYQSFSNSRIEENTYLHNKYANLRYIAPCGSPVTIQGPGVTINWIYKPYLNKIITERETIELFLGDREDIEGDSKKIEYITIKDNYQNHIIKRIDFNYDYYISNASNRDSYMMKRLKLDKVFVGEKEYELGYNSTPLPNKDSREMDFWGYYNGVNGFTLLPSVYFRCDDKSCSIGSTNRFANEEFAKAGVLSRIKYPTKGYTTFEFELNSFTNSIPNFYEGYYDHNKGAGLRIKAIKNFSEIGLCTDSTNYEYEDGCLQVPINNVEQDRIGILCTDGKQIYSRMFYTLSVSSSPRVPLVTSLLASPVCYGKVRIIRGDIMTTKEFHTENTENRNWEYFQSIDFGGRNWGKVNAECPIFYYFHSGLPSYEYVQEKKGEEWPMLWEKSYRYNTYTRNYEPTKYWVNVYAKQLFHQGTYNNRTKIDNIMPYYRVISYPFVASRYNLTEETTITYDSPDDEVGRTDSIIYEYNLRYNLPTIIRKTTRLLNTPIEYQIKYPWHFDSSVYSAMINKNMINYPIESITKVNREVINRSKREYSFINSTPFLTSLLWAQGENAYITRSSIEYDNNKNIIQMIGNDGIPTAYLWGYHNYLPVIEVKGAFFEDIKMALGEQIISDINNSESPEAIIENIRNSLKDSNYLISSYLHKPLIGVTKYTSPNGNNISYSYDNWNRLCRIFDKHGRTVKGIEYNYRH